MPEPVPGSQSGASSILTEFTLSPALLEQLKDVLRASLVGWAAVRVQDERALVLPAPDLDALYAALDGLLGGAWSLRYAVDQVSPAVVRAALIVRGTEREGLGQGHTLSDARLLALADACRAYGADDGTGRSVGRVRSGRRPQHGGTGTAAAERGTGNGVRVARCRSRCAIHSSNVPGSISTIC